MSGIEVVPADVAELTAAARQVKEDAIVWRGDTELRLEQQGVTVLGAPCHNVRPSATTSSLRPSNTCFAAPGQGREQTRWLTPEPLPRDRPGLLYTPKNPLLPRTLASAHAARWCPRMSSGRPHRQVREHKGMGRRKKAERLRIDPRLAAGGKSCVGSTTGHWDIIKAWSTSPNSAVKWVTSPSSTGRVAFCYISSSVGKALHQPLLLHRQSVPRGCLEPYVDQSLLTRHDCSQTGCWITLQTQHHCVCDRWVTFSPPSWGIQPN